MLVADLRLKFDGPALRFEWISPTRQYPLGLVWLGNLGHVLGFKIGCNRYLVWFNRTVYLQLDSILLSPNSRLGML